MAHLDIARHFGEPLERRGSGGLMFVGDVVRRDSGTARGFPALRRQSTQQLKEPVINPARAWEIRGLSSVRHSRRWGFLQAHRHMLPPVPVVRQPAVLRWMCSVTSRPSRAIASACATVTQCSTVGRCEPSGISRLQYSFSP